MDNIQHPLARLIAIYARHTDLAPSTVAPYATSSGATYDRLVAGRDITTRRASHATQWLSDRWPATAEWPSDIPRPAPSPDGDPEPPSGGAGHPPPALPPTPADVGVPARGGPSSAPVGPSGGGDPEPASPAASLKQLLQPQQSGSVTAPPAGGAASDAPPVPPDRRTLRTEVGRLRRALHDATDRADWPAAYAIEQRMQALATTLGPDGHVLSPAALVQVLAVPRSAYDYAIRHYAHGRRSTQRIHPNGDAARVVKALLAAGDARFAPRPGARGAA